MQSPGCSVVWEEHKLVKGAGFTTLYCTDKIKIELSAQGKYLRVSDRKEGEQVYERIIDGKRRKEVEARSENWKRRGGRTSEYYIREQLNAYKEPTGYYKIRRKEKTEIVGSMFRSMIRAYSEDDWEYFEKRGQ